jgi:hypothetical protein
MLLKSASIMMVTMVTGDVSWQRIGRMFSSEPSTSFSGVARLPNEELSSLTLMVNMSFACDTVSLENWAEAVTSILNS